jgi:hypothetical protein
MRFIAANASGPAGCAASRWHSPSAQTRGNDCRHSGWFARANFPRNNASLLVGGPPARTRVCVRFQAGVEDDPARKLQMKCYQKHRRSLPTWTRGRDTRKSVWRCMNQKDTRVRHSVCHPDLQLIGGSVRRHARNDVTTMAAVNTEISA